MIFLEKNRKKRVVCQTEYGIGRKYFVWHILCKNYKKIIYIS